jgi:hypothetical protein
VRNKAFLLDDALNESGHVHRGRARVANEVRMKFIDSDPVVAEAVEAVAETANRAAYDAFMRWFEEHEAMVTRDEAIGYADDAALHAPRLP